MTKHVVAAAISLAALAYAFPVQADERLAKFDGGIGVIPTSNNVVRGVNPAGQIWVIADLRAAVKTDGSIRVDGRGLLLGGGDNIGRTNNQRVRASLFCGPAATASRHDSDLVDLELDGDFRIADDLTPAVPTQCGSAVLLIVNAGGAWFAAGIPKE